MFPLSAEKLPLREIADFWSREIHPPASKKELLAKLESAWWLGEITGDSAGARLRYLGKIFEWRKLPGPQPVVFTTPSDEGLETSHRLANGEVVVDIRPRISVPRNKKSWSEDSCRAAFTILATMPSYEYFPELSLGLLYIELTEEEFFGWIHKRGFDPPKFWKRTAAMDVAQASDISINSQVAPTFPTTGRGAKTRAILRAYRSLSSNGMIHDGTTSQRRNDLILDKLRSGRPQAATARKDDWTSDQEPQGMLIGVMSSNVIKCRERPHDEYQNPFHYSFHRRALLREDARRRWIPFSRILLNWIVC